MNKLLIKAIFKLLSATVTIALLLFLPAATFNYPGAWRMIIVLTIPMIITGIYLFKVNPRLLEKRLNTKETQNDQKIVILFSAIMFIVSFLLCGFDYKYNWSKVPTILIIVNVIIFILTYIGFVELLKENEYLSRTVELQENQKVVDTGMYSIVRHPMYFIILFMFISMPLIIGSFIGLIPLIGLPLILVKRIKNEEEVLEKGLKGYKEYKQKVKYRLIPFVW